MTPGRLLVAGLCLTQVVGWGVLYYAFPVLAPAMSADTGWSATTLAATFSAGLGVSAVVGIPVGRAIDRHGPRVVMTAGSVLAVVAVVLVASAGSTTALLAAWLLGGVAMAAVLYQPAFTAVTRWYGTRSLPAIATVTLVGGLASTVFAPLAATLSEQLGWRGAYLTLAVVLLITVPVHLVVLGRPWPPEPPALDGRTGEEHAGAVVRSRRFWLLGAGLALASLSMSAAVVHLVPLLIELGTPVTVAAWALGLGGAGQVAGRIAYTVSSHRVSVRAGTLAVYGAAAASTAALAVVSGPVPVLMGIVVAGGIARGIATLLKATAVTDRWGPRSYGRLSGLLAAPAVLAGAVAPWAGAVLAAALGSYAGAYAVLGCIGAVAAGLLVASAPAPARRSPEPVPT